MNGGLPVLGSLSVKGLPLESKKNAYNPAEKPFRNVWNLNTKIFSILWNEKKIPMHAKFHASK